MAQVLNDARGKKIGEIRTLGSCQELFDEKGMKLGWYDGTNTFDTYGRRIGSGNLLSSLLRF